MLILSAEHVSRVTASFTTHQLQSIVARPFISLSHDDLVSPHRTAIDMPEHRALFMPARIADIGTTIKVVSVPLLSGDARGLPASTLVLDEKTGATKALVNARSLTALRTAVGSVLATVLLHPPATAKFRDLVVFGSGLQIRSHIRQLLATYPSIARITVVIRTLNARVTSLLTDLRRENPRPSLVALSSDDDDDDDDDERRAMIEAAVRQADCICCATPSIAPLFPSEWVRPGAHVILVGSYKPEMVEVDTALIRRARAVLVDSRSACALEAGELIAAGVPRTGMVEVGELLRRVPASDDDQNSWAWEPDASRIAETLSLGAGDVTIFKSVGFGEQDLAIAVATVDRAMEMGIGTIIPDFES